MMASRMTQSSRGFGVAALSEHDMNQELVNQYNNGATPHLTKTVADLGLPGVHLHDLRHAGNIWAAQSGTSTADLMRRLGKEPHPAGKGELETRLEAPAPG